MYFVIAGVLMIALNLLGIGPFGAWNWEFSGDLEVYRAVHPGGPAVGLGRQVGVEQAPRDGQDGRPQGEAAARESGDMGLDYRTLDKDKERAKKFKAGEQRRIDEVEAQARQATRGEPRVDPVSDFHGRSDSGARPRRRSAEHAKP